MQKFRMVIDQAKAILSSLWQTTKSSVLSMRQWTTSMLATPTAKQVGGSLKRAALRLAIKVLQIFGNAVEVTRIHALASLKRISESEPQKQQERES